MPLLRADGLWRVLRDLPNDHVVPAWETLLLDARLLLESERLRPEVDPRLSWPLLRSKPARTG